MSIKKKLFKNGIANVLQKTIRVAEQLFLVPFFITAWGVDYYGEWLTLTIVPSVLAFSDLGFGSAAANSIVLRYTSNDRQGAANIAKAGVHIITKVIVVGLAISAIPLLLLNYFGILEKSAIPAQDATWAISLMMISKLLNFYQQLFDGFFRAARKASLSINLMNIYTVASMVIGIAILQLGGNIVAYAVGNFVISCIFNPIFINLAYNNLRLKEMRTAVIIRNDVAETFKTGLGFMLSPVWQAIFFQGTTFAVRIVLGPSAVAIFNTVRALSRSINQLYTIVNSSVFPELQFELGKNNMPKARNLYSFSIISTLMLAIPGMLFLALFGIECYQIWTKYSLIPPKFMWYTFIVGIGFNALWWTAAVIFRSLNKPFVLNFTAISCALISIALTYFLCKTIGITGAAIGYLSFDILMSILILPRACGLIGSSLTEVIKSGFTNMIKQLRSVVYS